VIKVVQELIGYRDLVYMLTLRDVKIKYKQSVMGFMWAILMPMLIVSVGILVRIAFSKLSGQPVAGKDIAAVSVKAVPWAFFVASVRFATVSLISNATLVTKIYFPRELLPLAAILSQFFDFIVASIAISFALTLAQVGMSWQLLWLPLLVGLLFLLALGLGILFSALALFYRDVKYLVEILLMFGIFFTPVLYDVRMFGKWASILLLNPLAPILEGLDACVIRQGTPPIGWLAYSAVWSLSGLFLSLCVFKNLESAFAENI
jgi:lipopolysaccharide transport system permease protein